MRLAPLAYFGEKTKYVNVGGIHLTLAEYRPQELQAWHSHANPTFAILLRGGYEEIQKNGSRQGEPLSVFWHPPTDEHSGLPGILGCTMLNIEFTDEWTHRGLLDDRLFRNNLVVDDPAATTLVAGLHRELRASDVCSEMAVEGLCLQLLSVTGRSALRETVVGKPAWLTHTLEFLEQSFRERVRVAEAARIVNMSPVSFSIEFRRKMGITFHEYVRRKRIDQAAKEVLHGEKSFGDIAMELGFADQAHFSREFKRVTGMTPRAFKRRGELY